MYRTRPNPLPRILAMRAREQALLIAMCRVLVAEARLVASRHGLDWDTL